jgi:CRISP-associated protein Cas1
MAKRVIEIGGERRYLHCNRGFLEIKHCDEVLGQIPLDDIEALIVSAQGATITLELINRMAERLSPIITCNRSYRPTAWLWPVVGNSLQAKRMDAQVGMRTTAKDRLWKDITVAKITNQGRVLSGVNTISALMARLAEGVKNGDSSNREAVAAQHYWKDLFGSAFKRNRDDVDDGTNALLNFGYTVLRSSLARAIMGSGLNPIFGLHHKNQYNDFRLVDDLIEPFRPVVDLQVKQIVNHNPSVSLTPSVKASLVSVLEHPVRCNGSVYSCSRAAKILAKSYVAVCTKESRSLVLPEINMGDYGGGIGSTSC